MLTETKLSRKLHIGGQQQEEGWEILNANPGPHVDHACNAINLEIFESDTFSISMRHMY